MSSDINFKKNVNIGITIRRLIKLTDDRYKEATDENKDYIILQLIARNRVLINKNKKEK